MTTTRPTIPTEAGKAFPVTATEHWLLDDERALYTATKCKDLGPHLDVSVKLHEYLGKRTPKKLTPEQEARESAASALIHDYARACDPGVTKGLLWRLARERREAAQAMRPEVAAFALLMEVKLRENDHKGGWKDDMPSDLMRRLREETNELWKAMNVMSPTEADWLTSVACVGREAADVANFAMMIADVGGALAPKDG